MKQCNHILALTTEYNDYDEPCETIVTCLNDTSFNLSLDTYGVIYNYCSSCGANLNGVLQAKIDARLNEIEQEKEQARLKAEKLASERLELFNNFKSLWGLDNVLKDGVNYFLRIRSNSGKSIYAVAGAKDRIFVCLLNTKEIQWCHTLEVVELPHFKEIESILKSKDYVNIPRSVGWYELYNEDLKRGVTLDKFCLYTGVGALSSDLYDYSKKIAIYYDDVENLKRVLDIDIELKKVI